MSKSRHSTHEAKKKPLHSPKEKRAMKIEKRHAALHETPEIKIVQGNLKPSSA